MNPRSIANRCRYGFLMYAAFLPVKYCRVVIVLFTSRHIYHSSKEPVEYDHLEQNSNYQKSPIITVSTHCPSPISYLSLFRLVCFKIADLADCARSGSTHNIVSSPDAIMNRFLSNHGSYTSRPTCM